MHLGVMKEHHRTGREFGQPSLKIVFDGFVGVQAIDVEQINALVCKARECMVKRFSQQRGESGLVGCIV